MNKEKLLTSYKKGAVILCKALHDPYATWEKVQSLDFDCTRFEYKIQDKVTKEKSSWDTQVGGDHYTSLTIQPMEYSMANKLDPLQHTAIKYITRFRNKAGKVDLQKARDCIDMLLEWEYKD